MAPQKTLIDQRGYWFRFPMLGLPDRSGEWFDAKMVIAIKDIDDPDFLFWGPMEAPLRRAPKDCGAIEVEHKGTVYILPLVPSSKPFPETELFTIKVRRERASSMPANASRLDSNAAGMFFATHPEGMSGLQAKAKTTPATEADEKAFWQRTLGAIFTAYTTSAVDQGLRYGNMYTNLPSTSERDKLGVSKPEDLLEWAEMPAEAFDKEWLKEAVDRAIRNAEATKSPITPKGPGITLSALPDDKDGSVRFEYAVLCHDLHWPGWDEWKALPPHAFKPGRKKAFTSQVNQVWEKKAGSEVQWEMHRMAKGKKV